MLISACGGDAKFGPTRACTLMAPPCTSNGSGMESNISLPTNNIAQSAQHIAPVKKTAALEAPQWDGPGYRKPTMDDLLQNVVMMLERSQGDQWKMAELLESRLKFNRAQSDAEFDQRHRLGHALPKI